VTAPSAEARTLARRVGADEAFFDYTRVPYEPASDPAGKWSSAFVLEAALDAAGASSLKEPVRALGATLGVDATVWGAKQTAEGYSWELYFYDYTRTDSRFGLRPVLDVLGAVGPVGTALPVDAGSRHHFMFSVDVAPTFASENRIPAVHLYFYDVGERMTGLSYGYGPAGWVLENHYAFYEPSTETALLNEKVRDSPHFGPGVAVERVLVPELLDCRRVCVANKPTCDGVYFSGVRLSQFIHFLESWSHDPSLASTVRAEDAALDHMLYDVAFDYRASPAGEVQVLKTAFYGTV
jgi:hypothetical protein